MFRFLSLFIGLFRWPIRSLESLCDIVLQWDMSNVCKKLADAHPEYTEEYLTLLEREYKRYTIIVLENPGLLLTMPEPIDEFLHTHLLFTEDYDKFADMVTSGGRLIHQPTSRKYTDETLAPIYRSVTVPTYNRLFGDMPEEIWPQFSKEGTELSTCGVRLSTCFRQFTTCGVRHAAPPVLATCGVRLMF